MRGASPDSRMDKDGGRVYLPKNARSTACPDQARGILESLGVPLDGHFHDRRSGSLCGCTRSVLARNQPEQDPFFERCGKFIL